MSISKKQVIFENAPLDTVYFDGSLYRELSPKEIQSLDRYSLNPKISFRTRVRMLIYRAFRI